MIHLASARALQNPTPFLHLLSLHHLHRLPKPESLCLLCGNTIDIGVPTREPQQEAVKSSLVLLDVNKMMCSACAAWVWSILSTDNWVKSAVVNMLMETVVVHLEPGRLEGGDVGWITEELIEWLTECGFPAKRQRLWLGVGENVKKWREMAQRKEKLLMRSRNRFIFA